MVKRVQMTTVNHRIFMCVLQTSKHDQSLGRRVKLRLTEIDLEL